MSDLNGKSQLECYLEQIDTHTLESFDKNDEVLYNHRQWLSDLKKRLCFSCTNFVSHLTYGIVKDICLIGGLSSAPMYTEYHKITTADIARWMCVLILQALILLNYNQIYLSFFPFRWIVNYLFGTILLLVVVIPLVCGASFRLLLLSLQFRFSTVQVVVNCVLGVVKRLQLVAMGRAISAPLPPVHKLEESLLRSEGALTCREVRATLQNGLQKFLKFVAGFLRCYSGQMAGDKTQEDALARFLTQISPLDDTDFISIATSANLMRLVQLALSDAPIHIRHVLLLQLVNSCKSVTGSDRKLLAALSTLSEVCLSALQLPLQVVEVMLALNSLQQCVISSVAPLRLPASVIPSTEKTPTSAVRSRTGGASATDSFHLADAFLATRAKVARLRSKYEEIANRLYLCELELCGADAMQMLLADRVVLQSSVREKQVALLNAALDKVHGTVASSTSLDINSAESTLRLQNLEHLHRSLPHFFDLEEVHCALHALITAHVTGTISAAHMCEQLKSSGSDDVRVVSEDRTDLVVERGTRFRGSLVVSGDIGDEVDDSHGGDSRWDLYCHADESGCVDVYTATAPKEVARSRTLRSNDDWLRRKQQEEVEKESLLAKSFLLELSSHLHRKEAAAVKVERVRRIVDVPDTANVSDDSHVIVVEELLCQERASLDLGVVTEKVDAPATVCALETSSVGAPAIPVLSMADLRSGILSSSILPCQQQELCYSYSDDEQDM